MNDAHLRALQNRVDYLGNQVRSLEKDLKEVREIKGFKYRNALESYLEKPFKKLIQKELDDRGLE